MLETMCFFPLVNHMNPPSWLYWLIIVYGLSKSKSSNMEFPPGFGPCTSWRPSFQSGVQEDWSFCPPSWSAVPSWQCPCWCCIAFGCKCSWCQRTLGVEKGWKREDGWMQFVFGKAMKGLNMPKQHMEHLGQFINGYDASTKWQQQ